jgi:hypothetical protein
LVKKNLLTSKEGRGKLGREEVVGHNDNLNHEGPETRDDQQSCGSFTITVRRVRIVEATNNKEDHTDGRLTVVDDFATSESISTETPDYDSQQVDAAGKGISVKSNEERASKA